MPGVPRIKCIKFSAIIIEQWSVFCTAYVFFYYLYFVILTSIVVWFKWGEKKKKEKEVNGERISCC